MIELLPDYTKKRILARIARMLRIGLADGMTLDGHVKISEYPKDASLDEWLAWWPRLTDAERDRYLITETHNLITNNGRSQALTYIGSQTSTTLGWSQYFAVGNTSGSISANDTSLFGELYRQVPTTVTTSGTRIDVSIVVGTSSGAGSWSNCGLFGVSATGTANSGTLMSHAYISYTKVNGTPVTVDYYLSLN